MKRMAAALASGLVLLAGAATATAEDLPDGFTVALSMSPVAAQKLAKLHEGVVIAAWCAGDPAPGAPRRMTGEGQIQLGDGTVTVEGDTRLVRVNLNLRRDRLRWVKGDVQVLVNVYSARRSGPDNILECGIYDGPLRKAARAPLNIACRLIGE